MAKNPAFLQKKIYTVAQTELDVSRHAESNAAHIFEILEQSFEDLLAQDNKVTEKVRVGRRRRSRRCSPWRSRAGC